MFAKRPRVWMVTEMSKGFSLAIFTPQRQFYQGEVEAVTVTTVDGELTILKDHAAITLPLTVGNIKIKRDGKWKEAFQSEGFLEVAQGSARVFVQTCEWPEDIDTARAQAAAMRAQERLLRQQNNIEYQWTKVALSRALARLRVTKQQRNS